MAMEEFEYPVAVTRQRYITRVGGHTTLLKENQIGLHAEAIISRTNLSGGEEVIIDPLGNHSGNSTRSLFARQVFEIIPLTDLHDSRLLAMSSDGEAVISKECPIKTENGEKIELNSGVDNLPENWTGKLVKNYVKGKKISLS